MKFNSLLRGLFLQYLVLTFIFAVFVLLFSYWTIFNVMEYQHRQDLHSELSEIRSVAENFDDVLTIIRAETSIKEKSTPCYRIFDMTDKTVFETSCSGLPSNDDKVMRELLAESQNLSLQAMDFLERASGNWDYLSGLISTDRLLVITESKEHMISTLKKSALELLLKSSYIFLVLLIFSWISSKKALRGIYSVISSAKQISKLSPQKQQENILAYKVQESSELSEAFNELLATIHQHIEEVHRLTDNMSHDFKTTLHRIRAQAESLFKTSDDEAVQESQLQIMEECDSLNRLINGVLDISRYSTGDIPFTTEKTNVKEVVEEIVSLYLPAFETAGLDLQFQVEAHWMSVGSKVYKVLLTNCLDNMLKYTVSPGKCRIVGELDFNVYILSFENSANEMTEEEEKLIFKRFFRLDSARQLRNGHGLGLSICKALIDQLGASIQASRGELGFRLEMRFPNKFS